MMRTAIIVEDGVPVNVIVLADGPDGDALLSESCIEITDMEPKPGVGNGWTFVNGAFIPPPPVPPTWDDIRSERDRLLAASDWTQVADAPLTAGEKQAWADYRQTLRDIPQDFATPDDVVWPEAP
jgi:hypothetical protein